MQIGLRMFHLYRFLFLKALAHKDVTDIEPSRWHLDEKTANLRRRVFYECYHADKWRSLSVGRPSYFSKVSVSCELPQDEYAMHNGQTESGML